MADSRIHVIYENASGHNRQGWVTIPQQTKSVNRINLIIKKLKEQGLTVNLVLNYQILSDTNPNDT